MSGVTRMNVSVPREVKDMIDSCEEEVNWSAVATQAFRTKLAEVGARKKEPTIDDAILRLRMTAANNTRASFRRGQDAGRHWALTEARADQLMHAEKFYLHMIAPSHDTGWPFDNVDVEEFDERLGIPIHGRAPNPDKMEGARRAAHSISMEEVRRRVAVGVPSGPETDFAEAEALRIFGPREDCEDPLFLEGFIVGAVGVWLDVKDRI